ncbi:hypothetical protein HGB07_03985 [Candidatus Roizmanbacteria bacterium]|nr:hypothetical protein [Candidatus Roizmanbacteria bacterium]
MKIKTRTIRFFKSKLVISLLIALPIFLALSIGYYLVSYTGKKESKMRPKAAAATAPLSMSLPTGWSEEISTQSNIVHKYVKDGITDIKPTVLIGKAELADGNFKNFSDTVIRNFVSSINTWTIKKDDTITNKTYTLRHLDGYFITGTRQVNVRQDIFAKGTQAYVVNAIWDPLEKETTIQEIDTIMKEIIASLTR